MTSSFFHAFTPLLIYTCYWQFGLFLRLSKIWHWRYILAKGRYFPWPIICEWHCNLPSMWYLVTCWSLNPIMCSQLLEIVYNFIWGEGIDMKLAKVKWNCFIQLVNNDGFGIIDPMAQSKALLVKLLVRGLFLDGRCGKTFWNIEQSIPNLLATRIL